MLFRNIKTLEQEPYKLWSNMIEQISAAFKNVFKGYFQSISIHALKMQLLLLKVNWTLASMYPISMFMLVDYAHV